MRFKQLCSPKDGETCRNLPLIWSSTTPRHKSFQLRQEGSNVDKFHVTFDDRFYIVGKLVSSWIHFAVTHCLKDLCLDFSGQIFHVFGIYSHRNLPSCIFNCGSLTVLTLKSCDINLPKNGVCLTALRVLNLQQIELDSDVIEVLTSNSPVLENIVIENCYVGSHYKILAKNGTLKSLRISDLCAIEYKNVTVEIYAPHLLLLELSGNFLFASYTIGNLPSLAELSLDFEQSFDGYQKISEENADCLKKLLYDLHHLKVLKLCSRCIQVLITRAMEGLDGSFFSLTRLEVNIALMSWEFPGVAYLLNNSPYLETLVMNVDSKKVVNANELWMNFDFNGKEYLFVICGLGFDVGVRSPFTPHGLKSKSICETFGDDSTMCLAELVKCMGVVTTELDSIHVSTKLPISVKMGLPSVNTKSLLPEKIFCDEAMELFKFLLRNSRMLEKMMIKTLPGREWTVLESPATTYTAPHIISRG
ncbi:hypothetical protein GIB67_022580 [Kingdonia uniflora]|uniref:At1g61320/AtMIF1 LRR domain-containing protein n=1 Tax=Kingdonia uniflora TaxID=39325 RepID=A0A7J7L7C9_9MAGN|nr:hypothetical protein GIB67_022580 [Kingdonia uniflora]